MDVIGSKCRKFRRNGNESKPFKSGMKFNTIKSIVVNPYTNNMAYSFEEDDSCVDCKQIIILKNDEKA
jgi:hypothetical protein